jgi:hypothetical protein
MKILLNLIATNKYLSFLDIICPSIEDHFFPNEEVTVLVHTNLDLPDLSKYSRIKFVKNEIVHEPWPFTTLKRFEYFLSARDIILDHDYSFYVDVDSLFLDEISGTLLPKEGMIGTIHPCLFNGPGTPERNPVSKACIPFGSDNRYFCGGFFGGRSGDFIKASKDIYSDIVDDLSRGVIAIWHDESHLNRYLFQNPPVVILDVPFAVAENMTTKLPESKVLFLDKASMGGHDFFRS